MGRPTSRVSNVRVVGPLAPFADGYKAKLNERGYTPLTVVNELRQVAQLSRWMEAADLAASELTAERVGRFLAPRRAARGSRACSLRGLMVLLEVLIGQGVLSDRSAPFPPVSADGATLARFRRYLLAERGLAACTADAYVDYAGRFLRLDVDGELTGLTAGVVTAAVQREAARVSAGSTQYFVAGLRAFLRFCFLEGLVGADLSAAALAVTGRRRCSLPKGISGSDAAALLRSCDRRRANGRRDYAVLLVLLRLGLRAVEVARLTLDDIDWRAAEVVVYGKGSRVDRLPIPGEVGEAIVGYLQRGRPRTSRRVLFLRVLAPIGPLSRGGVSFIVRHACRRAGIAEVGAHQLRHTLACEMVAAGVALPEIGEVLRHRGINSTAIYARVDVELLRSVALPWPGGAPR
jgi:integrase/recombinase XerD